MSSLPITPSSYLLSHIAALKTEMENLPKEKTAAIQVILDDLSSSISKEASSQLHLRLQESIASIKKLTEPLLSSEKIDSLIKKLFQSECKAELLFYLQNHEEIVPEEARERIKLVVENCDLTEEIEGLSLIFLLARSADPFLRGFLPMCLDKGANPAYFTPKRNSLMRFLILHGDTKLVKDLAARLNPEDLKKVLLAQHEHDHKCALELFDIENTPLLIELMEAAKIPPDQPLYETTLFLCYVGKALNRYRPEQFLPFLDKYYHQLGASQLQKALALNLSNKKSDAILRQLIIHGVRPSSTEQKELFEKRVIEMLMMDFKITENYNRHEPSAEFLEKCCLSLIYSGDLPLFLETVFTLDILPKTATLQNAISKTYPTETIHALKSHFHLLRAVRQELSDTRSSFNLITFNNKISELHKVLNDPQFSQLPGFYHFKINMQGKLTFLEKELQEREAAVIQWMQEVEKKPTQLNLIPVPSQSISLDERPPLTFHLTRDIHAYVKAKKKWHLQAEVIKHKYIPSDELINKAVFHFLLDKALYLEKELKSGSHYRHGTDLMDSIELYIPLIDQDPAVPSDKKEPLKRKLKALVQSIAITVASERKPILLYQAFQQGISPLIVATGHQTHSALLALYQKGDNTTALVFNTGNGIIDHHPVGPDQFRVQTFIGVDQIPSKTITHEQLLQFHSIQSEQKDIEPLYKLVDELAQRGNKLPPSNNPYAYEMAQQSGTCSAQCWMALLRYHLCTELGGSSMESIGLYKIVKRQILKIMSQKRLPFLSDSVRDETKERLKEISYQEQLWELCQSEAHLSEAHDLVSCSLKKYGISPDLCDSESLITKYFALERNLRQLAKLQAEDTHHQDLGRLTPFLDFLRTKRRIRIKRYLSDLKEAREKQDVKELYSLIVIGGRSQLPRKAWLEEDYLKDSSFWSSLSHKGEEGEKLYKQACKIVPQLMAV